MVEKAQAMERAMLHGVTALGGMSLRHVLVCLMYTPRLPTDRASTRELLWRRSASHCVGVRRAVPSKQAAMSGGGQAPSEPVGLSSRDHARG